ncbi:hypothetical protein [Tropicimonas sp.]|uniref:hypothetical protein n=1 Tax=Tropicimonas sp. TaxID=2067044 RepID=UPI003A83E042
MPIRYMDLGGDRRISSIVFAGSHDASITGGKWNSRTQNKTIGEQARCGVRLFDLRIIGRTGPGGGSLVGYHGSTGRAKKIDATSTHTGEDYDDVRLRRFMALGTFGLKLSDMLKQARAFVRDSGEFLIFKFDKCENYQLIADYCTSILGRRIFTSGRGNEFGKVTLDELSGKVVCVFPDGEKGLGQIAGARPEDGILGFRSLKGDDGQPKPYDPAWCGLQYIGKGGTSLPDKAYKYKVRDNIDKQRKIMLQMAQCATDDAANVLGMMYWTSTGLTASIRHRDSYMWKDSNVRRMQELWNCGLEAAIRTQLARDRIKAMAYREQFGGTYQRRMKAFLPNIVMVDFADESKCDTIHALNLTVDRKLIAAYDRAYDELGFRAAV